MVKQGYIILVGFILLFGCNKEEVNKPVNESVNNIGLDCETCPSTFYSFTDIPEPITICDLFDQAPWPEGETYFASDTVGYSQEGTELITVQDGGTCSVNTMDPGLYMFGPVAFAFDGEYKRARFEIYGFYGQYNEMGFSVNGSEMRFMDDFFPMDLGGVTVDLDTTATNFDTRENSYLIFTGNINQVVISGFESGVLSLCVTEYPEIITPPITGDVHFEEFINHSGEIIGEYPSAKTPYGYYGLQGATMYIDFGAFLAYEPTEISFVHVYDPEETDPLLNVELPGTPLIVTVPDSLNDYLQPYGYTAKIIEQTNAKMWVNQTNPPLTGMHADSIVITGSNIHTVKIGANLSQSEMRSICSYYTN